MVGDGLQQVKLRPATRSNEAGIVGAAWYARKA